MKVRLPVAVSRWEKNLFVLLNDLNWSIYQPTLTVGCQLLVVGCQLSAVSCGLWAVGCRLSAVSCRLSAVLYHHLCTACQYECKKAFFTSVRIRGGAGVWQMQNIQLLLHSKFTAPAGATRIILHHDTVKVDNNDRQGMKPFLPKHARPDFLYGRQTKNLEKTQRSEILQYPTATLTTKLPYRRNSTVQAINTVCWINAKCKQIRVLSTFTHILIQQTK